MPDNINHPPPPLQKHPLTLLVSVVWIGICLTIDHVYAEDRWSLYAALFVEMVPLVVLGMKLDGADRQRFDQWLDRQRCRQCGYNLTGNTSGVCPECGTPRPPSHQNSLRTRLGAGLPAVGRERGKWRASWDR